MDIFVQQVANGLMLGSTYALIALGLTLIYGIMHIPNFALSHQGTVAGYVVLFCMVSLGINYWIAILISIVASVILGVAAERGVFYPLRNGPHVNYFIAALALMMVLENGMLIVAGGNPQQMESGYGKVVDILGFTTTIQRILVITIGAFLLAACYVLVKKAKYGIAIAATAQDVAGAQLVGINASRINMMTFAIGSALAGIAIALIAPIYQITPTMGHEQIGKAFVVVILGGMGSIPGAMLGGYLLGMLESMGAGYVSSHFADVFAYLACVIFLFFKPQGFFGDK